MLLGKRVLGAEGAAAEKLKQEGVNKGVGLGKRVIAHDPQLKQLAQAAGIIPTPRASGNRVTARRAPAKRIPAPKTLGFSEEQVESMLATDANQWDVILEAESKRPDGARPAVAALILAAADRADAKPIPDPVVQELESISKVEV